MLLQTGSPRPSHSSSAPAQDRAGLSPGAALGLTRSSQTQEVGEERHGCVVEGGAEPRTPPPSHHLTRGSSSKGLTSLQFAGSDGGTPLRLVFSPRYRVPPGDQASSPLPLQVDPGPSSSAPSPGAGGGIRLPVVLASSRLQPSPGRVLGYSLQQQVPPRVWSAEVQSSPPPAPHLLSPRLQTLSPASQMLSLAAQRSSPRVGKPSPVLRVLSPKVPSLLCEMRSSKAGTSFLSLRKLSPQVPVSDSGHQAVQGSSPGMMTSSKEHVLPAVECVDPMSSCSLMRQIAASISKKGPSPGEKQQLPAIASLGPPADPGQQTMAAPVARVEPSVVLGQQVSWVSSRGSTVSLGQKGTSSTVDEQVPRLIHRKLEFLREAPSLTQQAMCLGQADQVPPKLARQVRLSVYQAVSPQHQVVLPASGTASPLSRHSGGGIPMSRSTALHPQPLALGYPAPAPPCKLVKVFGSVAFPLHSPLPAPQQASVSLLSPLQPQARSSPGTGGPSSRGTQTPDCSSGKLPAAGAKYL